MSDSQAAAQITGRIDRLPSSPPIWTWVARISFGAFFEIYETALTSVLAPLLVQAGVFHQGAGGLFGVADLATFGFVTFLGLFAGSLVFSVLADRIGRRPIFTYSLVWYALATLAMAAQQHALGVCISRFIAAIGVAGEIVAVDAYLSEMVPKAMRGRGFAISKALQYIAVPLAAILAAVLAHKNVAGIAGWRVMLFIPTVGALMIWWVRRGLPESPRWLAERGRQGEARAILEDIEGRITRRTGHPLPPVSEPDVATAARYQYRDLFRRPLHKRTMMLVIVSCATTMAYFGFGNWLPSLLEGRGVGVTRSLAYSAAIALLYPLVPFVVSFLADRFERKWQIFSGAAVVVVAGLLFAAQSTAAGWLLCGLALTLGNNICSYATHTYRSELFPTGVRARGIGVVYSVDRLAAACSSFLIGVVLLRGGVTGVLVFISTVAALAMAVVGFFGPRTRGLAPEAIRDEDVGGTAGVV
jgi:MFS transporter, putative metabolite:H+ symporter